MTSHSGSVYLSSNVYQPLTQSLISLVEAALRSVYCPLGGLVMLGGMWYRVFQNNQRVRKECPEAGCVGGSIMVILEIWSSGRCGQHCMYTSINRNISNESIDERIR